jgi:hypothetical protein
MRLILLMPHKLSLVPINSPGGEYNEIHRFS